MCMTISGILVVRDRHHELVSRQMLANNGIVAKPQVNLRQIMI
jgi:hypothetical protein